MLACLDLEGVLLPEIWIAFAEKTGIEHLRLTTRDIPDYDELMQGRLKILNDNNLKLTDIQNVIKTLSPLTGAIDFLAWLKSEFQVIILSDTFYQFVGPIMQSLDYPTLFCHELTVDSKGSITGYLLRQKNSKTKAVSALKKLNFKVIAAGDSYNDTGMLQEADAGILFCPPDNVIKTLSPLTGAVDFLAWLKSEFQVIILSDTFYQFVGPLMKSLDHPTLFCHELAVDSNGSITGYHLRQNDGKTKAVSALKKLNFKVIAAGDSYNDTGMLQEADAGILFCPPDNVVKEFPQFPVSRNYEEFKNTLLELRNSLNK